MNQGLESVVFSGIVAVRDRLLQLPDPLRLESGEPSFDTPVHIKEAMVRAMADNRTHYAPSTGIKPLKEAVLRKIEQKNNIRHIDDLNNVVVTNGGMHGLYCTLRTLLNPGDEVIIPQPNWTATGWIIRLAGGVLKFARLRPELNFRWDTADVAAQITPRTKAVVINSPHNPTGGIMGRKELTELLDLAEQHNLYVISDEAYEDIIYDHEHISIGSLASERSPQVRDRIVCCYTFSKSYAMTGWRLGYAVCSGKWFADNVKKMILYTINGVSTPTQYGGIAALEGDQTCVGEMRDAYRRRRDRLYEGVNQTEFLHCPSPPDGAFYLYAQITEAWEGSSWDLVNHLIDTYSLGSVPGDIFYDDQRAIRFSYACADEMIERAIGNLTGAAAKAAR